MAELILHIAITIVRLFARLLSLLGDWVEIDFGLSQGWFSAKIWVAAREKFRRRLAKRGRI